MLGKAVGSDHCPWGLVRASAIVCSVTTSLPCNPARLQQDLGPFDWRTVQEGEGAREGWDGGELEGGADRPGGQLGHGGANGGELPVEDIAGAVRGVPVAMAGDPWEGNVGVGGEAAIEGSRPG
jgi:hypothetical protein